MTYIAAYLLGVISFGILMLVLLILLHRPRYTAPTRRRNRDRLPEVRNVPAMPVCKVAREEGEPIRMYGVTGEER
jgi:hypothetical protein